MNKYIFEYQTNYGTQILIINAITIEEAKVIALSNGAWDTNQVTDITDLKPGIQYKSDT